MKLVNKQGQRRCVFVGDMQDFLSERIQIPVDPRLEALKADVLKNSKPLKLRQELIDLHGRRILLMLSNRVIQFVDQVAGNLGMDFTALLRGTHREFDQFLKSDDSNPCAEVLRFVRRLAPGLTPQQLSAMEEYERSLSRMRYATNAETAFSRAMELPTMISEHYFNSVLSAGVHDALLELRNVIPPKYPQAEVFHYLVRNVKWMPAFARVVSAIIMMNRKESWVNASGVMIKQARERLYYALLLFAKFRMWDGSEMARDIQVFPTPVRARPHPVAPIPRASKRETSSLITEEEGEEEAEEDAEFAAFAEEPEAANKSKGFALSRSSSEDVTTSAVNKRWHGESINYQKLLEEKYGDVNV
jgi:hypothetical protein